MSILQKPGGSQLIWILARSGLSGTVVLVSAPDLSDTVVLVGAPDLSSTTVLGSAALASRPQGLWFPIRWQWFFPSHQRPASASGISTLLAVSGIRALASPGSVPLCWARPLLATRSLAPRGVRSSPLSRFGSRASLALDDASESLHFFLSSRLELVKACFTFSHSSQCGM